MVVPRRTQLSIPPGSVNEDKLWLGRQRQVWFIQTHEWQVTGKTLIPWKRLPYVSASVMELAHKTVLYQVSSTFIFLPLFSMYVYRQPDRTSDRGRLKNRTEQIERLDSTVRSVTALGPLTNSVLAVHRWLAAARATTSTSSTLMQIYVSCCPSEADARQQHPSICVDDVS